MYYVYAKLFKLSEMGSSTLHIPKKLLHEEEGESEGEIPCMPLTN